ncbi:hypothetical protein JMJ56_31440 [Belnapia sp. T18]|uniref:Uncharacterized protein n=1 Tax=Belnapia arida TaxID=2804533 RepID=A0ABS1UCS0_9PROT|nr:hypothetical protein [Belnapia arida]MBL6082482.1 hypothetical protein [Belnapia arida]
MPRLHILSGAPCSFAVMVALSESDAVPEALMRPGSANALLTHDPGMSWTDRRGEALARATIEAGGAVAFAFVTLGDAMACHRRIAGGRPQ